LLYQVAGMGQELETERRCRPSSEPMHAPAAQLRRRFRVAATVSVYQKSAQRN
jgi:hypothetical protein